MLSGYRSAVISRRPWSQRRLALRAADPAQVAAEAVARIGGAHIQRLDVRVRTWERPPGWIGAPDLPAMRAIVVTSRRGGGRVRIRLGKEMDPGLALAGALRVLRPEPDPFIGPEVSFAPGLPLGAAALAGGLVSVVDGRIDAHLRVHDTVLAPVGARISEGSCASVVTVAPGDWPVDLRVHNPIGRNVQASDAPSVGEIEPGPDGSWFVRGGGVRLGREVSSSDVRALRDLAVLRAEPGWLSDRRVAQLRACGMLVTDGDVPTDALERRARAHADGRAAMLEGCAAAALERWPSVSVLALTNRPDLVEHLIAQVAALDYPRLEILIGLHGADGLFDAASHRLSAALDRADGRQARVVRIDGALPFGASLQRLAMQADGELLTKVDDDDWYAPSHVWDLVLARSWSGATIVGKALDWIEVRSADCTVYRPVYRAEAYATFVAGGTLLISAADLRALGGWRPVPKSVDRALLDQARAHGALVYRTAGLGYCYVRHSGQHTAKVRDEHFLTRTEGRWPGRLVHPALGTRSSAHASPAEASR